MPFHEVSRMDARLEFVMLALEEGANVRRLCRRFGISPTTGYKWLERWRIDGMAGLEELPRRPQNSPLRSAAATENAVLSVRTEHPAWGGRKIARRLKDLGHEAVPAPSTVTAILKRHGIELGAHGGGRSDFTRFERACSDELWQMDFKGHVALHAGRLDPLTVLDDHPASPWCLRPAPTSGPRRSTAARHRLPSLRSAREADHRQRRALGRWTGSPFTPLGVWLISMASGSAIRGRMIRRPWARTNASIAASKPKCCPALPSPISLPPSAR